MPGAASTRALLGAFVGGAGQTVGVENRGLSPQESRCLPGVNDLATTHPHLVEDLVGTDPRTVMANTKAVLLWRCPNHVEPYPQPGYRRAAGGSCGYCAGQRVLPGFNDMATTHPGLAAEVVGIDPTTVITGTNKTLLWRCPKHDEPYPCTGANRLKGLGCGYCSNKRVLPRFNDLATTHPDLAAELVEPDPTTVIAGTTKPLAWRCPNHPEPYEMSGVARLRGRGCPYCAKQRLLPGFNDLATTHPQLAAELVGTDPTTVMAGTDRVLTWSCPNHEGTYEARGASRSQGRGCPICHGLQVLPGYNDMATTHPDLAADLAETDPTTVTAGSGQILLWRCPNHEQPYPQPPLNRVRGHGCGYCSNRLVLPGYNDLATTHPELALELVDTDPATVTAGTGKRLTWRCLVHDRIYYAVGASRVRGSGCASCADYGFDPLKPAIIYLMSRHGEQQIGITGDRERRLRRHRSQGWVLIDEIDGLRGDAAYGIEKQLKAWLAAEIGCLPGTTEAWSTARLEAESLKELLAIAGLSSWN